MISVNTKDIEAFRKEGVVCLRGVVDPSIVASLRQGICENLEQPGPGHCEYTGAEAEGRFCDDYCNWQRIPSFRSLIASGWSSGMVRQFLSSRQAQFYHEHIIVKDAGTAERTPWHADYTYYGIDGEQGLSLWIPLDAVGLSDSVEFVAGSHRWGSLFRPRKFIDHSDYPDSESAEPIPDIDAEPGRFPIRTFAVEPGDLIAFHMKTIHGQSAGKKPASCGRRTFVMRWLGDDVVFSERPWETSPPFAGLPLNIGEPLPETYFPIFVGEGDRRD